MGLQEIVADKERKTNEKERQKARQRTDMKNRERKERIEGSKRMPQLRIIEPEFWRLSKIFSNLIETKMLWGRKKFLGIFPMSSVENNYGTPQLHVSYAYDGYTYNRIELSVNKHGSFRFSGSYGQDRHGHGDCVIRAETYASHSSSFSENSSENLNIAKWLDQQFETYYKKCKEGDRKRVSYL